MATINLTGVTVTAGVPSPTPIRWDGLGKVCVIKAVIDLTGGAITENDIYQVLAIPANTLVRSACVVVNTAGVGTTLTIDVGIGGDDSFFGNIDGKATGVKPPTLVGVGEASVQGVFYSTADTIDVTMDVATLITAGPKLTVMVECVDFN